MLGRLFDKLGNALTRSEKQPSFYYFLFVRRVQLVSEISVVTSVRCSLKFSDDFLQGTILVKTCLITNSFVSLSLSDKVAS